MFTRLLAGACLVLAAGSPALAADAGHLKPRVPLRKIPTDRIAIPRNAAGEIVATGRLLVKFHDSVRARAPLAASDRVRSTAGEDLASVDQIVAAHRVTVRQALNFDEARLRKLEQRAESYSRKAQPDLAGMIFVEGPLDTLVQVARELNALPTVEFVEFEQEMIPHIMPAPAPAPLPLGEDLSCATSAQDCFATGGEPFCGDFVCCTLVGSINPFCVNLDFGQWDAFCVDLANLFCEMGDRCKTPLTNGGCYEAHPSAGCNNEACCNTVCAIQAFCCDVEWDETCAIIATLECGAGGGGPTPDFTMDSADPATRFQKYMTVEPSQAGDAFFDTFGFSGDGLDIEGLELLGQILIDVYGVGTVNGARGKDIRVGIVEHSAYVTGPKVAEGGELWHEDLEDVIPEPGQTIITIAGGNLSPDHGTSTLGQCVAADNGFGITGIAKDAQGYFFPIVSVEEGGRTFNAITAAIDAFDPGDVLNFSIGPGGGGTLVSASGGAFVLISLATDSGITCVISAGNDCFDLDQAPQEPPGGGGGIGQDNDSGAVIVGACWPGAPDPPAPGLGRFCRLGFSNHCRQCGDDSLVHCSAWGILVTTTGGGDLFGPPNAAGTGINKARAYTATFNGTSSAAPIVAGLAACLQGLAKQFYGLPLPPTAIRGILSGNGFPQCDFPNPGALPGSSDQNVCGGDFDPQEEPRLIGGFPRAFECGIGVITGNFFSGSPINDVKVVTGNKLFGNVNAIKQVDGNFLIIESVQRFQGDQGNGTPPAIVYIVGGQTTDIEVSAYTGVLPSDVTGVAVQALGNSTASFLLTAAYVYNWVDQRWTMIPQIDYSQGGGIVYGGVLGAGQKPENHVSSDGVVFARVWTCGLGAVPKHKVFHDFVDVLISDVPGFDPFGGDEG